jgi:hypothetical protein
MAALHMGSRRPDGVCGGGRRGGQGDELSAFHAAIIPFSAAGWQWRILATQLVIPHGNFLVNTPEPVER